MLILPERAVLLALWRDIDFFPVNFGLAGSILMSMGE